ncbi:glycosyl transferase, group 1 family protein [Listeria floridensis FSL S10-1187]|uniref:Glycosyl transferase, group 1 family protein n=1 Tax=Listeria floridensis FSL S10-1187 TaxID=1265817 RepID=A0ABN0RIB8_9LIST|nr:CDP-glycerol glycerophosphotransferase family protein [Listeria floridensis]EUJ33708.1 glycosyl transferase, group 1 family protein [Listeria floridensis FSL S10-1187]
MKKVAIIGFNIFAPGGTSRSNINLTKDFMDHGFHVALYNTLPFTKTDIITLKYTEKIKQNISFHSIFDLGKRQDIDIYVITRESLFPVSKIIKHFSPQAMVIGEIHAPLDLLDESIDLSLDSIDLIRVSTPSIEEEFKKRYQFKHVVNHTVSVRHLKIDSRIISPKTSNLSVFSRFEDNVKDISYSIKLMDYLVNYLGAVELNLYINGYGPSETLFKNLINYYQLQRYVFLNERVPEESIYLSTSRFETFGYSIVEALAKGQKALLFPGEDGALKEIFPKTESIEWLCKDLEIDARNVLQFTQAEPNKAHYNELNSLFDKDGYIDLFENQYRLFRLRRRHSKNNFKLKEQEIEAIYSNISHTKQARQFDWAYSFYTTLKKWPITRGIVTNTRVKKTSIAMLESFEKLFAKKKEELPLYANHFFVESFHGKAFSGDPKYMALLIKEQLPDAKIFVSSVNQLVDMEIRYFGFEPLRLGSRAYLDKFKESKYVIVNGNTLDKAGKREGQIVIQTWHGFPLKKMVADLEDVKQREKELQQFLPRMKKWDYLLSSSDFNTELFRSAFKLEENPQLKIIENGAPRNKYLIANRNNLAEKEKLHLKYFNRPLSDKRYILFCPTWRKDDRKDITSIDLKTLIRRLPDDMEIIVKLHPLEASLRKYYKSLDKRIHCFFNELVDIQELFILADVLISDYSSAIFDFAHLNKKIIILQEDAGTYQKKIGWYFDIEKVCAIAGKAYDSFALAKAIILTDRRVDTYCHAIQTNLMSRDSLLTEQRLLNELF